jgi:hypothetical protein
MALGPAVFEDVAPASICAVAVRYTHWVGFPGPSAYFVTAATGNKIALACVPPWKMVWVAAL